MNACTFQRIADLDNLVRQSSGSRRCIVMLHGFGANFADLTGVAGIVDPEQTWDWYFPNAPLEISFSPEYVGRAWFPLNMQKLEQVLRSGDLRPFRNEIPAGFSEASMKLASLISDLGERYDEIVVGGFSQGSMVACDFALQTALKISGLLLLSSNIVAASRWQEAIVKRTSSFPIFQSHGQYDNVLPVGGATELSRFFGDYGYPLESVIFQGGHEIPYPVLKKLKKYLKGLAGKTL